jgi:hypothetical protein
VIRELALAMAMVGPGPGPIPRAARFPIGTTLPIRFLGSLTSGRDLPGTRVRVRTMGALARDDCVIIPPYVRVAGAVTLSRSGRVFGGGGALSLRFDSLEIARGRWVPIDAVLDTLEYTPRGRLSDSGVAYARRGSVTKRAIPVGLAGAADVAGMPVALVGGYWLARRGPPARIVVGEVGRLRLLEPLELPAGWRCQSLAGAQPPASVPSLPPFAPRTATKRGRALGDPLNLILLGTAEDVAQAFRRAGWVSSERPTVSGVSREIVAGLANRAMIGAPLSTQYFRGRGQDAAYELAGPNARLRHHARFWRLDSLGVVWVGAGTEDIGMKVNPFKGRFTHRIRSAIDAERDRIVRELEATGCGALLDYIDVPDATRRGRNASGQWFVTDGRAAVVSVRSCHGPVARGDHDR